MLHCIYKDVNFVVSKHNTMLRTLTLKSQMKFGKYENHTVDQILTHIPRGDEYLRWVYYNMSNISFMPDLLERIGAKTLISKPGKLPELHYHNEKVQEEPWSVQRRIASKAHMKRKVKAQEVFIDRIGGCGTKDKLCHKNRAYIS